MPSFRKALFIGGQICLLLIAPVLLAYGFFVGDGKWTERTRLIAIAFLLGVPAVLGPVVSLLFSVSFGWGFGIVLAVLLGILYMLVITAFLLLAFDTGPSRANFDPIAYEGPNPAP